MTFPFKKIPEIKLISKTMSYSHNIEHKKTARETDTLPDYGH